MTDWRAEGQRLGASVAGLGAVVVMGADPTATALVALGIAYEQIRVRRVLVADAFGEAPPLEALRTSNDPHGIIDCFTYAISLSRVAHQVEGTPDLFVALMGSERMPTDELLRHPTWSRLAQTFRDEGTLLIIAAPTAPASIAALVAQTDGAISVGDPPPTLHTSRVIAVAGEAARRRWTTAAIAGLGASVCLVLFVIWLALRPLGWDPFGIDPADKLARGTGQEVPGHLGSDTGSGAGSGNLIPVANPADSATAAMFAVELTAANTEAGAILKLRAEGSTLPAATYAPRLVGGSTWYPVLAGAFSTRAEADSLLARLRQTKQLDSTSGIVVRVPYAFRIDSGVPIAAVPGVVKEFTGRDLPVYALDQGDGRAWILVGAFDSPAQSTLYANAVRALGGAATLVYRKGRPFP